MLVSALSSTTVITYNSIKLFIHLSHLMMTFFVSPPLVLVFLPPKSALRKKVLTVTTIPALHIIYPDPINFILVKAIVISYHGHCEKLT